MVIPILGGLGAAMLWAGATLASSRSSRMLGSRVILAWIMIVGTIIGLPIGLASGVPTSLSLQAFVLLLIAGLSYAAALYIAFTALTVGKVGIVAPIIAAEGAIAALIAVALGDDLQVVAAVFLAVIAIGVVLSAMEPAHPDVPAGDIEIAADALDGPPAAIGVAAALGPSLTTPRSAMSDNRKAIVLALAAAAIFGVGIVATGHVARQVPPIWVSISVRAIGLVIVTLPIVLQRRLTMTRAALPLILIGGTGEVIGGTLSAWGGSVNIAITAVLGSQFAAIAAVVAFLLFKERLSRTQVFGVILIVSGVTALAAVTA
jgi:drug/metabolite transporter (DMT)-like permease